MPYRLPSPPPTRVAVSARADIGRQRSSMEDAFLVADLATGLRYGSTAFAGTLETPGGVALAALDAMDAWFCGSEAAHVSADALRVHLSTAPLLEGDAAWRDHVRAAMSAANQAILDAMAKPPFRRGMGCAATLAVVRGDRLHLAQAGDTRAYVMRKGRLLQVTHDDSLINDAHAQGLPPEQIARLPEHVIVKALGIKDSVDAAVSTVEIRAGDVILVCSDGLTTEVDDRAIERTLTAIADPDEACLALLNQALRAGGADNIAILVARPEGDILRPPGPADTLISAQPAIPC